MATVFLKAGALWVNLVILAILNGIIRETLLASIFGAHLALPVSGILLSLLIVAFTLVMIPWLGRLSATPYWLIGSMWLVMTVGVEIIFGHYLGGHSFQALLAAYDVTTGNLWLLVLLTTFVSPYLAARIRGII